MYNPDIDECLSGDDNCSDNANCTNTDGGYNCSCHIGYTGDGFNCTSILMLIGNMFCSLVKKYVLTKCHTSYD